MHVTEWNFPSPAPYLHTLPPSRRKPARESLRNGGNTQCGLRRQTRGCSDNGGKGNGAAEACDVSAREDRSPEDKLWGSQVLGVKTVGNHIPRDVDPVRSATNRRARKTLLAMAHVEWVKVGT